jgi:hypothetical protein
MYFHLQDKVLQDEQPKGKMGYTMQVMLTRLGGGGGDMLWVQPWTCLGCWE